MKKSMLLIILTFRILTEVFSQSCLPNGIEFFTQAEIDSFQTNYPNCTEIEGDVIINGSNIANLIGLNILTHFGGNLELINTDSLTGLEGLSNVLEIEGDLIIYGSPNGCNPFLTSLNGLNNLTSIGGDFRILSCDYLTSLYGLSKLSTINGIFDIWNNDEILNLTGADSLIFIGSDITIFANDNLTNLNGLENLTSIYGCVDIYGNSSLTDLSGLNNVSSFASCLFIHYNVSLTSLNGLDNMTSVDGDFHIVHNNVLIDLSNLSSCTYVGGDFHILSNDTLTSLTSLNNITSIGGSLKIGSNSALTSLTGLDSLTSIIGRLTITYNNILTNLEGISNIDALSIDNLYIIGNPFLSNCAIQSVCDYIASPNGVSEIENNNIGCNSKEEVELACTVILPDINMLSELVIYPNPAKNEISFSSINYNPINEAIIYNHLGQKVFHYDIITGKIDISTLSQGIYVLEIVSENLRIRKKLIIR